MEENLISKKDLLIEMGISYGQLYRWKRKNIIPEEWFIKKSTFTGQETFFPKDKIIERINIILSMKEGISLDDIANVFIEKESSREFNIDYLLGKKAISKETKVLFNNIYSNKDTIGKKEFLILSIIEKYMLTSKITIEELKSIVGLLEERFVEIFNGNGKIYLYRKMGVHFIVGCSTGDYVSVDSSALKIIEVDVVKEISSIYNRVVL